MPHPPIHGMPLQRDPAIAHDPDRQRFVCHLARGDALAAYRMVGGVMHLTHTEVPPALQGQGIAAALVQAALDHARAQGWKVRPLCSYVAAYMRRHPDTQDLLA